MRKRTWHIMGNKSNMDFRTNIYILKRKLKAFLCGLIYYGCWIFPVDCNKIVMWTFEGKGGYGCSPKYIAEELMKRNKTGKTSYKIVWLLNDIEKSFPGAIKTVKSTLWTRAYHLSTSKFWVANTRTFYGAKKRKKTIYIQTWHGTVAIKPIGKYRGDNLPKMAYIVSKYDSKMIDYALSGSKWCTKTWPDGLIYQGKIIETGTPRCDVLFHEMEKKHMQYRKKYQIPFGAKILLYAPTFRGGSQSNKRTVNAETCSIDFGRVILALEKRFGGDWYVFLRLHPQLTGQMECFPGVKNNERLVNVSQEPDMNEIIAACDAFLTDYSSAIFESFLTGNPGFIYADDIEDYVADRGKFMFEIDEIPFSVAKNNDELIKNILEFNRDLYKKKTEQFIKQVGIIEDGYASERVVDLIEDLMQ